MRPSTDIERAMTRHGDTVWRVCVMACGNRDDAEDAFQDSFMKYALADEMSFTGEEHRKAWLIRVATNRCRDMQRAAHRKSEPLERAECPVSRDPHTQPGSRVQEVLDAMNDLDDPPRTPVYLALYEGYTAPEIADLLGAPVNTVYSWISRGRKTLKEALQ